MCAFLRRLLDPRCALSVGQIKRFESGSKAARKRPDNSESENSIRMLSARADTDPLYGCQRPPRTHQGKHTSPKQSLPSHFVVVSATPTEVSETSKHKASLSTPCSGRSLANYCNRSGSSTRCSLMCFCVHLFVLFATESYSVLTESCSGILSLGLVLPATESYPVSY